MLAIKHCPIFATVVGKLTTKNAKYINPSTKHKCVLCQGETNKTSRCTVS